MRCPAVSDVGAGCVLVAGHAGWHVPQAMPTPAALAWQAQRDEFWAACARRAAERERAKVKEILHPIVLVPTAAQRARGIRLVDAADSQLPKACAVLLPQIADALVRVTYSHALMPPKRGGEDWWDNHLVVLRVRRTDGAGWGAWSNGGWDGGQWAGAGTLRSVGAEEFSCLARGVPFMVVPPAACPACGKVARVKKDGGMYAHGCPAAVSDASLDSQARVLVGSAP